MAWESLISAVEAAITANGNNEITGTVLKNLIVNNLIPQLGEGLFKGGAQRDTNPGTPENKQFYIASEKGVYPNFNAISVGKNELCFLQYDPSVNTWVKRIISDKNLTFEDLKGLVYSEVGKNLFNNRDVQILQGKYISSAGLVLDNSNYIISGYIPITENSQYTKNSYYGSLVYSQFYNSDFETIPDSHSNSQTIVAPVGAKYVRVTVHISVLDTYQLEEGSTETIFKPYTDLKNRVFEESIFDENVTTSKIKDRAVTAEKTEFFNIYSDNEYNPDDVNVVTGLYLANTGYPVQVNSVYKTTGYIKVSEGDVIYNGNDGNQVNVRFIHCYDENKTPIDGGEDFFRTSYTVPTNGVYVRLSFSTSAYPVYQVNINSFKPYSEYSAIKDMKPEYLGSILSKSVNLFDIRDTDTELGKYVQYASGIISTNVAYNATGFIPVKGGVAYTLSYKHQIAWYGVNKTYISGSNSNDLSKTLTAPVNAAFLRCSVNLENWDMFQVEEGSSQTNYVAYGYSVKDEYLAKPLADLGLGRYESKLGKEGKSVTQPSLTSGNIMDITDFPYHLKKGLSMSATAYFSSFNGNIEVGKGYDQYRGDWLKIDGTNIVWINYDGTTQVTKATVVHGLPLDSFIKVTLYVDDSSVAYVILQSLNGYFTTTFDWTYEANYAPFIKTTGQDITDIKLNCTSKEFQKSIWAFGDSYFGVGSNRWPGPMKTFGFFEFLLNGLAGQNPTNALTELKKCLEYGTPKYILWCLGMNGNDTIWLEAYNELKVLCSEKGITLILATIPTVPTRNKEVISNTVRNSGYRFIDFYKAVGANSSGVWHPGYLDADGVHTSVLGAQALAMQVLQDVPELMQYGLTSTSSEIQDITGDN